AMGISAESMSWRASRFMSDPFAWRASTQRGCGKPGAHPCLGDEASCLGKSGYYTYRVSEMPNANAASLPAQAVAQRGGTAVRPGCDRRSATVPMPRHAATALSAHDSEHPE